MVNVNGNGNYDRVSNNVKQQINDIANQKRQSSSVEKKPKIFFFFVRPAIMESLCTIM